jgi:hypothetical protein
MTERMRRDEREDERDEWENVRDEWEDEKRRIRGREMLV